MTTLLEQLEVIAYSQGLDPDYKATLLNAIQALQRAEFSHYDRDTRYMLRLLQGCQISVGKACEWLRHYVLDGVQDVLPEEEEPSNDID